MLAIFTKIMYTNLERTGEFKCSNELINQLYSNQLWSNKSNYLDLPTDCNQRDERLGWLGDAWIFADTASYNFNVAGFFAKYIADVNFSRTGFGEYPQYAPFFAINHLDAEFYGTDYYKGHNAWADGAIICPYVMYNKYNDKKILSDHYDIDPRHQYLRTIYQASRIAWMLSSKESLTNAVEYFNKIDSTELNTNPIFLYLQLMFYRQTNNMHEADKIKLKLMENKKGFHRFRFLHR